HRSGGVYDIRRLIDHRTTKRVLHPYTGRTCKHQTLTRSLSSSKWVVRGVLHKDAAEVRLRSKIRGGHTSIDSEVATMGGLEIVVPPITNKSKSRLLEAYRLGQYGDLGGIEFRVDVQRFYEPVVESVIEGCVLVQDLPGLNQPFQALGCERLYINGVIK